MRAALATKGHPYDLSSDEFTLDIHSPETTFYFNDSTSKQLVQIVFYDQGHRVDGAPVIGLPLDEAMLPFILRFSVQFNGLFDPSISVKSWFIAS